MPTKVPRYQGSTFTGTRNNFSQMSFLPPPMTHMTTSGNWTQAHWVKVHHPNHWATAGSCQTEQIHLCTLWNNGKYKYTAILHRHPTASVRDSFINPNLVLFGRVNLSDRILLSIWHLPDVFTTDIQMNDFPSVLWHYWLGDSKGIRPVKNWMLVCWWWWFDWSFARLNSSSSPVVTITSYPPSSFASVNTG